MDVSIIIPVYNASKTISRTLNSIIESNNTLKIEIICINDGSTDKTLEILNKFKKTNNIKVINKKNSGASDCRNIGINNSTGEYLFFVDADDFIKGNMFGEMYNIAKQNDLCVLTSDYFNNLNKVIRTKLPYNKVLEGKEKLKNISKANTQFLIPYSWRNSYKREFLVKKNIRFNKDIRYGEDSLFNLECFIVSERMMHIDKAFYQYDFSSQGLMGSSKIEFLKNLEKLYFSKIILYERYNLNIYKNDLYEYTISHTSSLLLGELVKLDMKKLKIEISQIMKSEMFIESFKKSKKKLSKLNTTATIKLFDYLIKNQMLYFTILLVYLIKIKNHKLFINKK